MTIALLPKHAKSALPNIADEYFFDSANFVAYQEKFLKICQHAKKIIMHHWIKTKDMTENSNSQMAAKQLAEEIISQNKDVEIFVLPCGGTYDAPIHSVKRVKKIYAFSEAFLKAEQKA